MTTFKPFLTGRFDLAFQFASGLHHTQCRKGTAIPYISHLMSVAALVLEAGGNEDQVIAALLHDTIEDQGEAPTLKTIRRLFGDRVAETSKNVRIANQKTPIRNYHGTDANRLTLLTWPPPRLTPCLSQ